MSGRSGNGMDWDKLKVFHVVADAGSFTHAGETLGLSQSAVSRQISALEQELKVPLFHRHARGLILTEQGELLFRTAHDVFMKLETVRTMLADSKEKPNGELRITTAVGLGSYWLSSRIGEFLDLYPGIRIQLLCRTKSSTCRCAKRTWRSGYGSRCSRISFNASCSPCISTPMRRRNT
jgi:DNA-binding transcriptional LysR family regulator